ncbi:MAG: hypothetical protein QOH76_1431 [Thermoleophilaceae bacterium]|jgi:hypothetical protein|nr:hypothetical protein [Thermoleophilaceae bacterium]
MDRQRLVPAAAIAAYVVFWLAVLFGYLRVDSSDVPDIVFEILRGLSVVLPALALGFAVGRPRALLAGLVFLFAAVLPERTVVDGTGVDVTLLGTYGVSFGEALGLILVTAPCVIAGIALRRSLQRADASELPAEGAEPELSRRRRG